MKKEETTRTKFAHTRNNVSSEERMAHVEEWANYCRTHMKEAQRQLTPFINSQILNANAFYKRLAKMPGGKKKIAEIKRIPIKRLNQMISRTTPA